MADMTEIKTWCEEARKILATFGGDRRSLMKDRSSEVAKLLAQLKKIPTLAADYAVLLRSFEVIAARALQASKDGEQEKVAQTSRELSILKNQVRLKLAQGPGATKSDGKDAEKAKRKLASDEKKSWAREAFFARLGDFLGSYQAMRKVLYAKGLPAAHVKAFNDAESKVGVAQKAQDWLLAKAELDELERATKEVKQVYDAGKSYFDAYVLIETNFEAALEVYRLKIASLAVQNNVLDKAYNALVKLADAKDWLKAEAALPALDAASTVLNLAGVTALADKPGFELAFKDVLDLAAAQLIAKSPPLALVDGELKTFNEAYSAVNDAKNVGNFKPATDAIPALQTAIHKLIKAKIKVDGEALLFSQEKAKISGYANAQALAAENAPAVADKIAAFTDADGKVEAQVKLQNWKAALLLLGALKAATEAVLKAKTSYNTGYSEEKQRQFQQQLTDLKPRTNPAKTAGPTRHIDQLKKAVTDRLGQIELMVSSADHASAEMLLPPLLIELGALDTALAAHQQHMIKFKAAKEGAVKLALDCALTPKKLADERDKALSAIELRIQYFADKGSIAAKADPMVDDWIQQADAWKAAQAASDNLNSGSDPDPIAMRALEGLPGGGKVLDALMAGLPDGKPEKFIREAMKIRFGIDVTRFKARNPDELQNYAGLTTVSPDAPDKSLKKMYQLFCKVPTANVKGKVTDLIQFDDDADGAAAGGGKIWMYCGQPDGGSKQKFGSKAGVVADGETIDPDFVPVNEDEVPYFDFAALHEVGHAVDNAKGIMNGPVPGQIAGWERHAGSDAVAVIAAAHFKYNEQFVKDTLNDKSSTPPSIHPAPEGGATQTDWDKTREAVVNWCQSVRVGMAPWNNAALSKHVAINGRVYQESYAGKWVSYLVEARAKGITSYQFRSPGEWFAELYAAYFSGKLKKDHPYATWLKPLKKIT